MNLKKETKDNIRSLRSKKEELEAQTSELGRRARELSIEVGSLEEKKVHIEKGLTLESKLMKMKLESQLISLKIERPELFYFTGAEQMGKLVGYFLKWLLS